MLNEVKLRHYIMPIQSNFLPASTIKLNWKSMFVKMVLRASEKKCKVWTQAPTEYKP